jgi:hypothetical protein
VLGVEDFGALGLRGDEPQEEEGAGPAVERDPGRGSVLVMVRWPVVGYGVVGFMD